MATPTIENECPIAYALPPSIILTFVSCPELSKLILAVAFWPGSVPPSPTNLAL